MRSKGLGEGERAKGNECYARMEWTRRYSRYLCIQQSYCGLQSYRSAPVLKLTRYPRQLILQSYLRNFYPESLPYRHPHPCTHTHIFVFYFWSSSFSHDRNLQTDPSLPHNSTPTATQPPLPLRKGKHSRLHRRQASSLSFVLQASMTRNLMDTAVQLGKFPRNDRIEVSLILVHVLITSSVGGAIHLLVVVSLLSQALRPTHFFLHWCE